MSEVRPALATVRLSRRQALLSTAALAVARVCAGPAFAADDMLSRPIPHSGEMLPVIGLGTAYNFDVDANSHERADLAKVVSALAEGGGKVIDTSSDYGRAEEVVGGLMAELSLRPRIFVATKISSGTDARTARAEFERGLKRLKVDRVDLLQLHNVFDPKQSLAQLRDWKAAGRCRYIGVTSTYPRDYPAMEAITRREKPDFVQVEYSLGEREAEERIIPASAEVGAGIITALPFGRANLFAAVRGRPLPDFASEFGAQSFAQFFLKYLLGNQAVSVVIPGTSKAEHMIDDLGAGRGRLPDAAERARMLAFWNSLN